MLESSIWVSRHRHTYSFKLLVLWRYGCVHCLCVSQQGNESNFLDYADTSESADYVQRNDTGFMSSTDQFVCTGYLFVEQPINLSYYSSIKQIRVLRTTNKLYWGNIAVKISDICFSPATWVIQGSGQGLIHPFSSFPAVYRFENIQKAAIEHINVLERDTNEFKHKEMQRQGSGTAPPQDL